MSGFRSMRLAICSLRSICNPRQISKFTKFNLRPNPDGSLKLESNSDGDLGLRETLISADEVSNGDVRGGLRKQKR